MSEAWKEVQKLRNAGRAPDAIRLASQILAGDQHDIMTRRMAEWAYYDLIKAKVTDVEVCEDQKCPPLRRDLVAIGKYLQHFAKLEPERPSTALSFILVQLTKHKSQREPVAHRVDKFIPFLMWCGAPDLFREEDFLADEGNGAKFPSLSYKVAREAMAWIRAVGERASKCEREFVLQLALEVKNKGKDSDQVWLNWDIIKLLNSLGRRREASALLGPILKQKRTEWWVWSEAGRLYAKDNLPLAISCFCQAFSLCREPKFVGKAHCELAELFVQDEDYAQASQEVLQAISIYDREGWKYPRELEDILTAEWYDPSSSAKKPAEYYTEHAEDALLLCFDSVDESAANFIGTMELKGKRRPMPLYAVRHGDQCISILGKRVPKSLAGAAPGAPVSLLIGSAGENREILEVATRDVGSPWDQLDVLSGVVLPSRKMGKITIYFSKEHTGHWSPSAAESVSEFVPGLGVAARVATNPKTGRLEVYNVVKIDMPDLPDLRRFRGQLRLNDKGFGFVEDVFVPGELLKEVPVDCDAYEGIAVSNWDKKKERYGWCAATISVSE
ncbi:MAG: hypothetical protein RIC85_02450 [Gammaproteobacteria bacterium]